MGHGEPRKAKIITKGVKRGDFITLFGFHKEAKKNDEEEKKKDSSTKQLGNAFGALQHAGSGFFLLLVLGWLWSWSGITANLTHASGGMMSR